MEVATDFGERLRQPIWHSVARGLDLDDERARAEEDDQRERRRRRPNEHSRAAELLGGRAERRLARRDARHRDRSQPVAVGLRGAQLADLTHSGRSSKARCGPEDSYAAADCGACSQERSGSTRGAGRFGSDGPAHHRVRVDPRARRTGPTVVEHSNTQLDGIESAGGAVWPRV